MRRGPWVLVAAICSCTPRLDVPQQSTISCEADDDCPDGFSCATSLARCVPASSAGAPPPALEEDATITPSLGRAATVIEVGFTVTKDLGQPPVVVGDGRAGLARFD